MTIGHIPGAALSEKLDRQGVDLAVTTNDLTLLQLDLTNYRLGINTTTPQEALDVTGNVTVTGDTTVSGLLAVTGAIETQSSLSVDTDAYIGGELQVMGSSSLKATTIDGDAIVTNLTNGRIVLAGVDGLLQDNTNLTFDGTTLAMTGEVAITGNISAGVLNVASTTTLSNLFVAGNSIIAFSNNVITEVGYPVNTNDAATKEYVDELLLTQISSGDLFGSVITLAQEAADNIEADGAGIHVSGADAVIIYSAAIDGWVFNKLISAPGVMVDGPILATSIKNSALTAGGVVFASVDGELKTNIGFTYNDVTNVLSANIDASSATINNLIANIAELKSGTINNITIGGTTASTGAFTTLTSSDLTRFTNSTISTSPDTGALVVTGGAGIQSNLWIGHGAVINDTYSDDNFIVRGSTSAALIMAQSASNTVTIGGSELTPTYGATLKINGNDSILLPRGTTAQRPGNTGNTDVAGMIRYNNTIGAVEYFNGEVWKSSNTDFTVITNVQYAGQSGNPDGNVDGTNTVFTLPNPATTASIIVSINGIVQTPEQSYGVTGDLLTFTEPPTISDVIDVRCLTTTTTVEQLADTTGMNQIFANGQGISIASGTTSPTTRILVDTVGILHLNNGIKLAYDQSDIAVYTSPVIIDSFDTATYRSAKYLVEVSNATLNQYDIIDAIVIHDGMNANIKVTGNLSTGASELGTLSIEIAGTTVNLMYTGNNVSNTVKVLSTYIKI